MRHQKNRLNEIHTGPKKKSIFIRQLLTNLVRNGKVTTTPKRAKVLKAEADSFFSKLLEIAARYPEPKDVKRESIRYVSSRIFGEEDGKKVINTILPKIIEEGRTTGFVTAHKVGHRVGDASLKTMITII
jgi:ribosomal protein L17